MRVKSRYANDCTNFFDDAAPASWPTLVQVPGAPRFWSARRACVANYSLCKS